MHRNKNSVRKGINICSLVIGLLLCLLATSACAYPKRQQHHKDELQHQLLQLHRDSIPLHHSKFDYRTTSHPLWHQRSRCQCTAYRNQHKNNRDEIQLYTTELPIDLETTLQHENTAIEQRLSKYEKKLSNRKQRDCYCPRKGFLNRNENKEADDIVQRQLPIYHLREAENKLESEMSDENIAATYADEKKEYRRQRRHFGLLNRIPHKPKLILFPHGNRQKHKRNNGSNNQNKRKRKTTTTTTVQAVTVNPILTMQTAQITQTTSALAAINTVPQSTSNPFAIDLRFGF